MAFSLSKSIPNRFKAFDTTSNKFEHEFMTNMALFAIDDDAACCWCRRRRTVTRRTTIYGDDVMGDDYVYFNNYERWLDTHNNKYSNNKNQITIYGHFDHRVKTTKIFEFFQWIYF